MPLIFYKCIDKQYASLLHLSNLKFLLLYEKLQYHHQSKAINLLDDVPNQYNDLHQQIYLYESQQQLTHNFLYQVLNREVYTKLYHVSILILFSLILLLLYQQLSFILFPLQKVLELHHSIIYQILLFPSFYLLNSVCLLLLLV